METQTTTVIGRNIADIDELASWIRGLIGRGIAHWDTPNMVIRDIRSIQPFFHKFDDCFDVLAIVVLYPEEQEEEFPANLLAVSEHHNQEDREAAEAQ